MSGRWVRWLWSLARHPLPARDGVSGGSCRLTVLRHHRVYAGSERPLYRLGVSERVLKAQLQLLERLGLRPITVAEGVHHLDQGRPGHRVAMSFDDGYADNVHRALPLLAEVGARATFFLTAGWIERGQAPWWDVLDHALGATSRPALIWSAADRTFELPLDSLAARRRALLRLLPAFRVAPLQRAERLESLCAALDVSASPPCALASWEEASRLVAAGMEVGAHTLTHPHLSLLEPGEQAREISGSIELIQRRLGLVPSGLAYPGGDADGATVAAARTAGLSYAVTTRAGTNHPQTPRFELRRRGLNDGACLAPTGSFSDRLARAELTGSFDRLRAPGAAT